MVEPEPGKMQARKRSIQEVSDLLITDVQLPRKYRHTAQTANESESNSRNLRPRTFNASPQQDASTPSITSACTPTNTVHSASTFPSAPVYNSLSTPNGVLCNLCYRCLGQCNSSSSNTLIHHQKAFVSFSIIALTS